MRSNRRFTTLVATALICALALAIGVLPTIAMIGDDAGTDSTETFDVADKFPEPGDDPLPRFRTPAERSLIEIGLGVMEAPSVVVLADDAVEAEPVVLPYTEVELDAFRDDFIEYLQGFEGVVETMQSTQWAADALSTADVDVDELPVPTPDIYASIETLDYESLALAMDVMEADPSWRTHPEQLEQAIIGAGTEGAVSPQWLEWSTIEPWDPDPLIFAGRYVAINAALAMELIPDDITIGGFGFATSVPNPINIGVTIAWGVAENAVITLEISADEYADTADAYLRDHAHQTGERVRDYLDYSVQSVDNRLTAHDNAVTIRFNAVQTALAALELHLVAQDADIAALDTHMDQQDTDRTTRFDFVDGEIAAIRAQLDAQDAYMADTRTLMMRMAIEENLLADTPALAVFQIPAADGGRLDEVRTIVTETISNARSAGLSVNNADMEMKIAEAAYSGGDYKEAYERYRAAYREAVR